MINKKTNTPPPGGYVQFEQCPYGDCRYKDAATGRCAFEACILTEEDESDITRQKELQKELDELTNNRLLITYYCGNTHSNKSKVKCNICGKIVSKSFKAINITICDRCLARLKKSASCHKCGNSPL